MWFLLEERGFQRFLVIGQPDDPLQKRKKHQNMHPQLININL